MRWCRADAVEWRCRADAAEGYLLLQLEMHYLLSSPTCLRKSTFLCSPNSLRKSTFLRRTIFVQRPPTFPSFTTYLPSFTTYLPSFTTYLPSFTTYLPSFLHHLPSFIHHLPSFIHHLLPSFTTYLPSHLSLLNLLTPLHQNNRLHQINRGSFWKPLIPLRSLRRV